MIFSKTREASFISHIDLPIIFGRAVRRAGMMPEMTQGFSPHQRIALGPPLPVGVEGLREPSDIWTLSWSDGSEIALRGAMPPGIRVIEAREIAEGKSLSKLIEAAEYEMTLADRESAASAMDVLSTMLSESDASGGMSIDGCTVRFSVTRDLERCGPSRMVARLVEASVIGGWPDVRITRTNVIVAG